MTSPYDVLERFPQINLIWTDDERVLAGRRARWFPTKNAIAIRSGMRRLKARCSLAHELGHVVLGHGPSCGIDFFDYRAELAADEFAARLLLDDLSMVATELATTCHHGHAAHNLYVTRDLFETRLNTLQPDEVLYVDRLVAEIQSGGGC